MLSCKERYCEGYSSHCCLSSICHTALTIGGTPRRRRPRSKSSIWLSSYTHHHGQTARIPHHKCEGCRKIAISTSTENVTDAENNYNERKRGGGYMADYNHYDDDDDNMSRGTVRSATELSADIPVRIFNFKYRNCTNSVRTSPPSRLVAIVGEDPIEQNEQEGVFLCGHATKPGRQEDGIILRHKRLGVEVR